jgi:N-acetylglucosamine malate deacetylase 2
MLQISDLLERTLVIVAHPDDECIAAGVLLQRIRTSVTVFCTDGAPRDDYFWSAYGSREKYIQVRQAEAMTAAQIIGSSSAPVFLPIIDQELYLNLAVAFQAFRNLVSTLQPQALLTLAYEGGHPDHDCCAFLARAVGIADDIPVWEAPLYHQTSCGPQRQNFLVPADDTWRLTVSSSELTRKQQMTACYKSQAHVLKGFDLATEIFRPQIQYDFSRPPTSDVINYEAWQWPIRAKDVCSAFDEFNRQHA